MTCEMMDQLISCYVDGALDADSCQLVEQHLEGCCECRETLEELRALTGACALAADEPPAGLRQSILSAVAQVSDCHSVAGLLPLAADSSLSPAEAKMVAAHTESCAACAAGLDQYASLLSVVVLAEGAAPESLRERIARRTYARPAIWTRATGALGQMRWPARTASAVAGACVIAALAWPTSHRMPADAPNPGALATRPAPISARSDLLAREASRLSEQALRLAVADAASVKPVRVPVRAEPAWESRVVKHKQSPAHAVQIARLPLPVPAQEKPKAPALGAEMLPAIIERPEASSPAAQVSEPAPKVEAVRLARVETEDAVGGEVVDVSQRIRDVARQRQESAKAVQFGEVAPGKQVTIKFWQAKF